jgi:hypothetical protein
MFYRVTITFLLVFYFGSAFADGWGVNMNSKSQEKCSISSSGIIEDERYNNPVGSFSVVMYDKARPVIKTSVTVVPNSNHPEIPYIMFIDKPAEGYYIDNNPASDDPFVFEIQRIFICYTT